MAIWRELRAYSVSILVVGGLLSLSPTVHAVEDAGTRFALLAGTAVFVGVLVQAALRRTGPAFGAPDAVETIPGLAWAAGADGETTGLSARLRTYLGLPAGEIAQIPRHAVHPADAGRVADQWRRAVGTGAEYSATHRLRGHDGRYRWFCSVAQPQRDGDGRIVGWFGTLVDIDDQKLAEEALRISERSFQAMLDNIPGLVAVADADGQQTYANKRCTDYYGISADALKGEGFFSVIHPDDREMVAQARLHCLRTGEAMDLAHRLRRHDGTYRWFHARVEPVFDETGRIANWYGLFTDIENQRNTEDALRASEREVRSIVDNIPGLIATADSEGNQDYANKASTDYFGLEARELTGMGFQKIIHPDDLEEFLAARLNCIEKSVSMDRRCRMLGHDGLYRWFHVRVQPILDDNGKVLRWYGISTNIDEQVRAQEALRAAQEKLSRAAQLAGLAELSASIAHEVNQPLAAVVTNTQACQRWLAASPPNLERARIATERIVRDSMAAAEVVVRVRALFAQKATTRPMIDLNEAIDEVRQMMGDDLAAARIQVEMSLDPALPLVPADRVQMQQVLFNLIRNGADAMRSNTDVPKVIEIRSYRQENSIVVEVHDTGSGMTEPGRVFDPFFTTKEDGMGMGLAVCRSVVESHDGRLWAESRDPRGTVFAFMLPISPEDAI